ncbi:ROK family protein [Paenibacillus sonchi]|uniref:ROK family protein n=1 Tax=Paenibacillus sonchi TaxID=373687 RepID=UPI001E4A49DA|nr:ROK family protein [Paenibacillus sonchi]MCE3199540.1 ROK family protein [Paenibacillus sonchi]
MTDSLVSIDMGGSAARLAIFDREVMKMEDSVKIDLGAGTEPLEAVSQLAGVIGRWEQAHKGEIHTVVAGLAGLHDAAGTIITWPNRPAWNGFPFREAFTSATSKPIILFDDANLAAMGEYRFGLAHPVSPLLYVVVGTGIGSALVLQGDVYEGARGASGELGHITVDPNGEPCPCGGFGCLQLYASGRAIERMAAAKGLPITKASDVFRMAAQGNEAARRIIQDSIRLLAIGIANAVRLLDPVSVVVGGGMVSRFPEEYRCLEKAVQQFLGTLPQKNIQVSLSVLGDDAALWGGLAYGLQQVSIKNKEMEGVHNE